MITCHFENKNKASSKHITVNAIVIKDSKILLGKRGALNGQPILESGKWALLGGFFDRDENLEQAVKREVKELRWFELDNLPAKEEMAFDHGEDIEIYLKFLKERFPPANSWLTHRVPARMTLLKTACCRKKCQHMLYPQL
ncbi:NUDIX hydrolase [Candidatus Daviesbacteria bacterium]|nr:NUDIX hydrolase [Candidatus Daviesbacteria bacterium]